MNVTALWKKYSAFVMMLYSAFLIIIIIQNSYINDEFKTKYRSFWLKNYNK